MIALLSGQLIELEPFCAIIDVNGVGYEVKIPLTTNEKLPKIGAKVRLFTLAIYREDSAALYGFYSREDKEFFQLVVEKVSGIGPRLALTILSKLSVPVLKNAIANEDAALLAQCPGIGKKTAQRLIMDLKDRVSPSPSSNHSLATGGTLSTPSISNGGSSESSDAITALITLGYKPNDADKAVRRALTKADKEATTETLIKLALN